VGFEALFATTYKYFIEI